MEPTRNGHTAGPAVHDHADHAKLLHWLLTSQAGRSADLAALDIVLPGLALMIEARDPYTEGHCERLSDYGMALGDALGLGREDIDALRRGGILHDLGKVGIPDAVLLKPGRLTDDEYELMKRHTIIGERLFGALPSFGAVRGIVRHHHERLDGSGYPDGLQGDQIPMLAQIVAIVDAFDAMTSTRPYRAALAIADACAELAREARQGTMNRHMVETFVSLVRRHEHQTRQTEDVERRSLSGRLFLGAA